MEGAGVFSGGVVGCDSAGGTGCVAAMVGAAASCGGSCCVGAVEGGGCSASNVAFEASGTMICAAGSDRVPCVRAGLGSNHAGGCTGCGRGARAAFGTDGAKAGSSAKSTPSAGAAVGVVGKTGVGRGCGQRGSMAWGGKARLSSSATSGSTVPGGCSPASGASANKRPKAAPSAAIASSACSTGAGRTKGTPAGDMVEI